MVKHTVGTVDKRKKVRKIIAPEEGSGDSKIMDQKPKKVTNNRFGQSILTNTRKKYHKE